VEGCHKYITKCNLTLSQMRNHWRMKHAGVEKMGWKRYEANLRGNLHKCEQCSNTYLSLNGLKKHISQKHGKLSLNGLKKHISQKHGKRRRRQTNDRQKRKRKT
jgi:hypothetical protein